MADNTQLSEAVGVGVKAATKEVTHGGDTTMLQAVSVMGVSGTEGAYTVADINGDATNGLDVDVTRSALPSGASTSAKQDTAQTALDAIKTAVEALDNTVAGSELQVDVLTSGLPTGAATSAAQTTLQTAIDLHTTALQLIDNIVKSKDGAAGGSDAGVGALVVRDDALTTLTPVDGDYEHLRIDSVGKLWTHVGAIEAGDTNIGNVDVVTLPALVAGSANIGDVDVLTVPADPFGANADAAVTAGATGSIQAKLRLQTTQLDQIKTAVELIDNAVSTTNLNVIVTAQSALVAGSAAIGKLAANSGVDIGDVDVTSLPTLPAGTNAIGKLAANSGVDIGDVDVTSISAGSNLIGNVGIGVRTSGGATPYYNLDVDETEDAIKASAGQLYFLYCYNSTAAPLFVKLYDATTANTTVGSTTPVMTIPVPANADSDGAGVTIPLPMGIAFANAITIAATTAAADADTGAPSAGAVLVTAAYA